MSTQENTTQISAAAQYLTFITSQGQGDVNAIYADENVWLSQKMIIEATDRDILADAGKVTAAIAKEHALAEFEKYRVKQDELYVSDFERLLALGEIEDEVLLG